MLTSLLILSFVACDSDYKLHSPPDEPSIVIEDDVPDIRVTPDSVNFTALLEGQVISEIITVENIGEDDLIITDIELLVGTSYSLTLTASELIAPGEFTEFTVTLTAGSEPLEDWIHIDSNDPDTPTVEVPLNVDLASGLEEPPPEGEDEPPFETEPDTGDPLCECPEGYFPTPASELCQRKVVTDPIYNGEPIEVCSIAPYFAYGMYGARYPDGAAEQSTFWGMDDGSSLGRLNSIGVWGCDAPGSSVAGHDPIGEWIGFAVCLELEEPGDYLVGVGADNRVRFHSDGDLIFEHDTGATQAFNYWWMQSVSLASGTHILEFEGKNDGSIAGFGAEVAGPFAPGSLTSDAAMVAADYESNILWSTADAIGSAFDIGASSGWVCPDGTTYSICDKEPECYSIDVTECL